MKFSLGISLTFLCLVLCWYCFQECVPAVSLQRAMHCLNNRLDCLVIFMTPPWPTSQIMQPIPTTESWPVNKRRPVETLYPPLVDVFMITITYLWSFHYSRFPPTAYNLDFCSIEAFSNLDSSFQHHITKTPTHTWLLTKWKTFMPLCYFSLNTKTSAPAPILFRLHANLILVLSSVAVSRVNLLQSNLEGFFPLHLLGIMCLLECIF